MYFRVGLNNSEVGLDNSDVDCSAGEGKGDNKEKQTTGQVGRVNPGSRNVEKFKECGDYHDEYCDPSSTGRSSFPRPRTHWESCRRRRNNKRRYDKNSVEVHEEVTVFRNRS